MYKYDASPIGAYSDAISETYVYTYIYIYITTIYIYYMYRGIIVTPFPVHWWCSRPCDGRCWPEASGPWLCCWASAPRCWDGPNRMAGPCAAGDPRDPRVRWLDDGWMRVGLWRWCWMMLRLVWKMNVDFSWFFPYLGKKKANWLMVFGGVGANQEGFGGMLFMILI